MGYYPGRKSGWFEVFTLVFGLVGVALLLAMIAWGMAHQKPSDDPLRPMTEEEFRQFQQELRDRK